MAEEMRSLYLIAGTDEAKIDATRARLRARAEREGGVGGAARSSSRARGRGMPDHEALLAAIPAMSLTETRAATCSPTGSSAGATASSSRCWRRSASCRPT